MNKKTIFKKQNIPNFLTILRIIFMILVVIFLLVRFGNVLYALPLDSHISTTYKACFYTNDIVAGSFFVIASITDFLDGFIARKYHWVSDFGKLWDPLADKLLINAVLICLAYLQLIPIWITLVLVLRDIIVDAFRMNALRANIVVAAGWLGKFKTAFQMIGLIFIFFFFHYTYLNALKYDELVQWYFIQNLLMLAAVLFSLSSMVQYIYEISKQLKLKKINEQKAIVNESK